MPIKKYLILSLLSLVIYSCANDSSSGPSPTLINGQWNSDQYLYSPNCGQQNLAFDDYISYLVVELQQYSAQTQVDIICNGQPEGWCESSTAGDTYNTNADSVYAIQLSFVVNQWDNDSTLTEMLIAENMIISDVSDIQLNINNDNTYTISWDGVCIDYPEFMEEQCNELSSGTWDGDSCEFLTEDGCESSFVNGTWDDGSSGVLDGDSDLYTMDDVDDDSVFEGNELNFDGSSISITVISTPELCVSLNFTK